MRRAIDADNDDIELVSNNYNGERYRSLTKVQKYHLVFTEIDMMRKKKSKQWLNT